MATKPTDGKAEPPKTQALTPAQRQEIIEARQRTPVGIIPQNLDEAWRVATYLAKSAIVPTDYRNKPEDIMAAIMYGSEVGIKPMAALKNIAVINGRPSIWGDLALAIIMQHPDYEDHSEVEIGTKPGSDISKADDSWGFTCTIKRKGKEPTVRTFTKGDAMRAKLWLKRGREGGDTPWVTYPQRMLQMRARSWAIRDRFADALAGLSIAEEAMDMEPMPHPTEPTAEILMPRRVGQSEAEVETRSDEQDGEPRQESVQVLDEQLDADREEYVKIWKETQEIDSTWQPDPDFANLGPEARKEKIKLALEIQYQARLKKTTQPAQQKPLTPRSYTQEPMVVHSETPGQVIEESFLDLDPPTTTSAPATPVEEPKKLKKDMTTAEKFLGPREGRVKPKRTLPEGYEKIKPMHSKKLHVVLNAAKVHTEQELYAKLWADLGIESSSDIPRESYPAVLAWAGGEKYKFS